ncbi:hypothetical protein [Anaerotruncus colihominis]|uniref:hypothetical protein n=1 Tax=Anaerotruncus colihominis TaxID=169435 RepID=UPI003993A3CA
MGGYGIHPAKVARMGVPFLISHTVVRAEGIDHLTGAVIVQTESLLKYGYVTDSEIELCPGVKHSAGIHPVIECTQNITCSPG